MVVQRFVEGRRRTLTAVSLQQNQAESGFHPGPPTLLRPESPPPPTVSVRAAGEHLLLIWNKHAARDQGGRCNTATEGVFLSNYLYPPFRFSSTRAVNGGFGIASETGDTER